MPLRISFNLADEDLRHFEKMAQRTQAVARQQRADAIIDVARRVLASGEQAHVAAFVRERFSRLRAMIEMATDRDWQPCEEDRQRVLNALACFGAPSATAAQTAVSTLDHGILIELVSRDLEHDLEAYRSFCRFRESRIANRRRPGSGQEQQREEWLAQKRSELHARMRQRRRRDLDQAGSSVRKFFSLFGL